MIVSRGFFSALCGSSREAAQVRFDCYVSFAWICLFVLAYLALPQVNAWAQGSTGDGSDGGEIGDVLCKVVKALTGRVGKSVASISVFFLAVALFLGKVSWGLAIAVALGIGCIFGAEKIVDWIANTNSGIACA